ncbi:Flavodoxin [Lachnospiraceae bacterium TWA4]|nr:Flavodoxin [Lachnospiraceae bacterium TWA4]
MNGSIKKIAKGNTEVVAEYIRDAVGADLFEVDTATPYSEDYMTCIEEAKKEAKENARPELKTYLDSVDAYDNIVIAGPCWWGTYPYAIFSQLEKLDFTGKKVFALMTHEGSGLAGSERDVKKYCKGAAVGKSLAVQGGSVASARPAVEAWAKKNLI